MKVMVWFYNHCNVLNSLVDETIMDMDVESDDGDDDAGVNEQGETEGDQLDQVKIPVWFCVFFFSTLI